jgi:hypothetical protein
MIISGYLAMTLFFRTVGCLCPDFDYAMKFAAVIITLFVLTSGYLIQWQSEQVWLRWIFYVNALGTHTSLPRSRSDSVLVSQRQSEQYGI